MKKKIILIGGLLSCFMTLILAACSTENDPIDLEAELNELIALSESVVCEDSSSWRITGLGSKPCGGPSGYIAYSVQIDTIEFLNKVNEYNEAVRAQNEREQLVSDCSVPIPPYAIQCQDGKAVLIYEACDLEPDPGPCFAAITRFYYDKVEQKCKEFIWGGCDGTVPFETMEACQQCEDR